MESARKRKHKTVRTKEFITVTTIPNTRHQSKPKPKSEQ